jgi:hypothetical protein
MSGRHIIRYDQREYECNAKGTADCKLSINSCDTPLLAFCAKCEALKKAEEEKKEKERKEREEAEGK